MIDATRAATLAFLLACPLPVVGFLAHAASPPAFDPTTLPAVGGKVAQHSMSPAGAAGRQITARAVQLMPPALVLAIAGAFVLG